MTHRLQLKRHIMSLRNSRHSLVAALESPEAWPDLPRTKSNVTDLVQGQLDEPEV